MSENTQKEIETTEETNVSQMQENVEEQVQQEPTIEEIKDIHERALKLLEEFKEIQNQDNNFDVLMFFMAELLLQASESTKTSRNQILQHIRSISQFLRPELHPCLDIIVNAGYRADINIVNDVLILTEGTYEGDLNEEINQVVYDIKTAEFKRDDFGLDDKFKDIVTQVYRAMYEDYKVRVQQTQASQIQKTEEIKEESEDN